MPFSAIITRLWGLQISLSQPERLSVPVSQIVAKPLTLKSQSVTSLFKGAV